MAPCQSLTNRYISADFSKKSMDQPTLRSSNGHSSPKARQSTKLGEKLKNDNGEEGFANFRNQFIKDDNDIARHTARIYQKQYLGKAHVREELVRYMSRLPSYLEKGENLQEKPFSVGVLDWSRLEKWQGNSKQIHYPGERRSPSSSSSISSTEGSIWSRPSRGHSCSPARQRMHHHTLQSFIDALPSGSNSNGQLLKANGLAVKDLKVGPSNPVKVQKHSLDTGGSPDNNTGKPKTPKENDLDSYSYSKMKSPSYLEKGKSSISKDVFETQDGKFSKRLERLHTPNPALADKDSKEGHPTVVLLVPEGGVENKYSEESAQSDSARSVNEDSAQSHQASTSKGPRASSSHSVLSSRLSHACCDPCESDMNNQLKRINCSSLEAKSAGILSDMSQPLSDTCPPMSFIPSTGRKLDDRKSSTVRDSLATTEESNKKRGIEKAAKGRSPSPTRRFSFGIGRIGRSSGSKDASAHTICQQPEARSGFGNVGSSAPLVDAAIDKSNAATRSQSSPLRRLLDPLLKPKSGNSDFRVQPTRADPTARHRASKSSNVPEPNALHSVKMKLDLKNCKTIEIDDKLQKGKLGSSMMQALLRVAVKNGLPLFTFAVDNNNDILAAALKLSSLGQDENNWSYTFFSIRELKKKTNNWLIEGVNNKNQGYIPNVIAQLKVSDMLCSGTSAQYSPGEFCTRSFVLFAPDKRKADRQNLQLHPSDELAAIVVKLSTKRRKCVSSGGQQNGDFSNVSARRESSVTEVIDEENGLCIGSGDQMDTTVILPGGDHGLPIKGEPPSLITRWKSGGLCDCGGWDLGCRIRVLGSQAQSSSISSSKKLQCTAGNVDLFTQGEVTGIKPSFSLSPFKDGVFSVEFDSSLKVLQAFAISLAILDSRGPPKSSRSSSSAAEKTSSKNDANPPSTAQVETSGRYVAVPPLSPVGRV